MKPFQSKNEWLTAVLVNIMWTKANRTQEICNRVPVTKAKIYMVYLKRCMKRCKCGYLKKKKKYKDIKRMINPKFSRVERRGKTGEDARGLDVPVILYPGQLLRQCYYQSSNCAHYIFSIVHVRYFIIKSELRRNDLWENYQILQRH